MGTKKVTKKHIRKLSKVASGNSYTVTIPKSLIKKFGWVEHQKLIVRKYKGKPALVVEDL